MRTHWKVLALLGVAGLALVFGVPLTHSPRYDALEPFLRVQLLLAEFEQAAATRNIPFIAEPGLHQTLVRVPLNGSMFGQELRLTFHNLAGLQRASIRGMLGDERTIFAYCFLEA